MALRKLQDAPRSWQTVTLGEVLRLELDPVKVDPFESYPGLGIYSFARGAFPKFPLKGAEIRADRLFRVRGHQLIYLKLKAFEGAFAVVPPELEGRFVTSEYPTFTCLEGVLNPEYLRLYFQVPEHWQGTSGASKGIGARRDRIHPNDLLRFKIFLPPFAEQERIVARVKSTFDSMRSIREAIQARNADVERLVVALAHRDDLSDAEKAAQGWCQVRLGDVMRLDLDPVRVEPDREYPNLGVYSFAKGVFSKPPIRGADIKASSLYRVRAGQFVYLKLNSYEGAYAVVPDELDGFYVTNEFPTFTANPTMLLPETLGAYFMRPRVWAAMASSSKGTPTRRQRANPDAILSHEMWLPPMSEQQRIAVALAAHRAVAEDRTQEERLIALERSILNTEFGLR